MAAVHEYIGSGAEKDGQVADGEVQHTHKAHPHVMPSCSADIGQNDLISPAAKSARIYCGEQI